MDISHYSTHAEIEAGLIKHYVSTIFDRFIQNLDAYYEQAVQSVHESERGQEILSEIEVWEKQEQELLELKQQSGESEEYQKRAKDFYYALPESPDYKRSKIEVANDTLREMISQEVLTTLMHRMHSAIERISQVLSKEQQMTILRVGHILCSERLDTANESINQVIKEYNEGNYDNWVNKDRYYDYFSLFRQLVLLAKLHIEARESGYKGEIPIPIPHGWQIPVGTVPTAESDLKSLIPNEHNLIQLPAIQRKVAICTYIVCKHLELVNRLPEAAQVICSTFCFEKIPHPDPVIFAKELVKCKNGDIDITATPPHAALILETITPLLRELKKTY